MAGSSGMAWVKASYDAGLISRSQMLRWAKDGLVFRLRGSTDETTREAMERIKEVLSGRVGPRARAAGAAGPGRGPAADLPADARRGLFAPRRGPLDVHRQRRGQRPGRARGARPRDGGRSRHQLRGRRRRATSPASSTGRSCTARESSRACGTSPSRTTSTLPSPGHTRTRHSDLPMLRAVGNAVAVNPDTELAEVARDEGWQVMRFEKLGRRLTIARGNPDRGADRRGRRDVRPAARGALTALGESRFRSR